MAPKTYHGNCHCGNIKFTVTLPAPIEETGLNACDCSICTKKGYLFVFVRKSTVTFTKNAGSDGLGGGIMVDYRFNSMMVCHRFCGRCGTPFGVVRPQMGANEGFALNARQFMNVDIWSLPVEPFSGGAPWRPFVPPVYPQLKQLLAQPLEAGEKIYPGSCHCGAVTFALKSPWTLDKAGPEGLENNHVQECDCSSCIRSAGIYTYPRPASRVSIHTSSPDALTTYVSPVGKGFGGEQFCSKCGCHLFQQLIGPPAERVAAAPAEVQAKIREKLDCKPVHLRALD
ncbi:Mss4-like protein, partial [Mycena amicta]